MARYSDQDTGELYRLAQLGILDISDRKYHITGI
jgi:hypothetical protein